MIEETERFIERFRYKATKAVQVQSRIKALDRIDRLEIEPEDDAFLNIRFAPAPRSGQVVTECRSVSKSYGSLKVLEHIDLTIERGNKVAFVGRNGEGKTTLARIIMGEIGYTGSVKTGHNVKTGYFAQNQADLLDQNLTVLETIDRVAVGEIRTKIRDLLGAFLFSGEDVDKKVSVLSGGERSRLAMIRLLLEPVNFLVLDEPTNHLDMRSKELLKKALIAFDGTILVVSHDREFLDGLVDCVYEFRDKKIRQHLGGIYDFLRKKKLDSLRQLEARATPTAGQGAAESLKSTGEEGEPGISFEEKKNINRSISRIERSIAAREESIASLEKELAAMDLLLSGSSGITPADVFEKYEAKREELADAFREWEREHEELEIWKAKKRW